MDDSLAVPPQSRIGDALSLVPPGAPLSEWAAYYATDRRWEVLPGTRTVRAVRGAPPRCDCGDPHCPAPGDHPLDPRGVATASSSPTAVRRQWRETPDAPVLLRTGRSFDVLDVSEEAGCLALARMERTGVQVGPVIATPGADRRMRFLVQAGGTSKLDDLVRGAGWPPGRLDLRGLGDGAWVAAPPGQPGGRGAVQWAVAPSAENLVLPEAGGLVAALAYACGRSARVSAGR